MANLFSKLLLKRLRSLWTLRVAAFLAAGLLPHYLIFAPWLVAEKS